MELMSETIVLFPGKNETNHADQPAQTCLYMLALRLKHYKQDALYILTVINKDMYQSALLNFYYKQAPPPPP